ncbi:MAG: radical SAM protein [Candidatus Eisenbacteria bacterium]|nr:radical SAM protein [Candidatus Eisenbacteria bacterium]
MRYVFGPVPSRRLGHSLGVDLVTPKTCSMDCIYCECGPTTELTVRRACQVDPDTALSELSEVLAGHPRVDYVTLSGSGEPTLNARLDDVIRGVRALTTAPVAVLTNGSLMTDDAVCAALDLADVVLPSLDAVSPDAFRRINRPHPSLDPAAIARAIADFSREARPQVWLESVFVRGVNDSDYEVSLLAEAVRAIAPERVHVNTVVRPPAVDGTFPVGAEGLSSIARRLGERAEVIAAQPLGRQRGTERTQDDVIVAMSRRRPLTAEDVANALGTTRARAEEILADLVSRKLLTLVLHDGKLYHEARPDPGERP